MQATQPPLLLRLLQRLAAGATFWTGAGAAATAIMAVRATVPGAAGTAAAMVATMAGATLLLPPAPLLLLVRAPPCTATAQIAYTVHSVYIVKRPEGASTALLTCSQPNEHLLWI